MSVLIKGITLEQFYRDLNNARDMDVDWDIVQLSDDVVERKRGKWIKDCDVAFFWKCSECGAYILWRKEEYLLRNEDEPNYCPNCGSRMGLDGDTE